MNQVLNWKDTGYSVEQDLYMTILDWFEYLTQSVWNVCIKFDTWKTLKTVLF